MVIMEYILYDHCPPSAQLDARRAVVSYKRKYVHFVLINLFHRSSQQGYVFQLKLT